MKHLNKLLLTAAALFALIACGGNDPLDPVTPDPQPTPDPDPVEEIYYSIKDVSEMTLWEKVGQMFNIMPYNWLGDSKYYTAGADALKQYYAKYPVGGILLKAENILTPAQIVEFNKFLHSLDNYPMLCVDEEGGSVARVAKNSNFPVVKYESAYAIGSTGNSKNALEMGKNIGAYLYEYGFDVDFAPVADVWTNSQNTVIGKRAFGTTADVVKEMVVQFEKGMQAQKVEGCLKHFPGHGNTSTDSHYGYASTPKTWDEMLSCEIIPFKEAIKEGAKMVMTAHISAPAVTGCDDPATVSEMMLTGKLRGEIGFKGIIITDSMGMGAITKQFGSEEAAIKAILAGADVILSPASFESTYEAVYNAVKNGTIKEERVNESVTRIIEFKKALLKSRGQLK